MFNCEKCQVELKGNDYVQNIEGDLYHVGCLTVEMVEIDGYDTYLAYDGERFIGVVLDEIGCKLESYTEEFESTSFEDIEDIENIDNCEICSSFYCECWVDKY